MKWIPVSESLPDENMQYVLCTVASGGSNYRYYTEIKEYIVTEGFGEMVYNEYYDEKDEDEEVDKYYFQNRKVTAWAPIPSIKSKIWNSCKYPPEKDYDYYDSLIVARETIDGIVYEKCLYCKDGNKSTFDACNLIKNSFGYIAQSEYDFEPTYHEIDDVIAWMVAPEPYVVPRPVNIEQKSYIPMDEIVNGEITEFDYYAWQPSSRFHLMEKLEILSMALCYDKRIDVYDIKDNKYFKVIIRNESEDPKEYYLSDKDFTIECKKLKYGMHMSSYDKYYFANKEKVVVNKILFKYNDAKYLFSDDFLLEETYKWISSNCKNKMQQSWDDISKKKINITNKVKEED